MKPAQALVITAAAALLIASRRTDAGAIEAADDDFGSFDVGTLTDRAESFYNQLTESESTVDIDTATANINAGLTTIAQSEGTEARGAYRVCYGYGHTIADFSDHPYITREWPGVVLSDTMCSNAGFGPGCKSTAAGRYQITATTWRRLGGVAKYGSFDEAAQDAAAIDLIAGRGALEDLKAGRFADFVHKCRGEWASLPGNSARQGQRSLTQLASWYSDAGGVLA
ncbi:MAG TPA: glycoside hydrolase family 104 protein [Burkholderiaceae bacterium]|nr:glycoside hydrolase family 104 protein [Burkholderiaceae bacterium]